MFYLLRLKGNEDEEVLQAIANHTLGRPSMSLLSCIVCEVR